MSEVPKKSDDICDAEPCFTAVKELGTAKDRYNARLQDFKTAAGALGFTTTVGVGALIVLVAAKLASKAVPIIGWILLVVDAALLIALGIAYARFRSARTALGVAKTKVREVCPRKCWPDNVLKEH